MYRSTLHASFIMAGLVWLGAGQVAASQEVPSIAETTNSMTSIEGYFNLYWDEGSGKVYWEIERLGQEFLYQVSLTTGLGSNPVGLDRGQLGGTYILRPERVGPRVLLVEPNYGYRARSDDEHEVRAVEEAFAPSTHWGFDVVAESEGSVLVEATEFFLRDAHGIADRLRATDQGTYRLDNRRSVFYLPRTKGFPRNTEVETMLTFTSNEPGRLARQTAASGSAITFRVHHSLVRLPEPGYTPRRADPRVSSGAIFFNDYAAAIDEPLTVRWIRRHRLIKRDPEASRSEPVEPIVYYVDRGTPEPIRSALIEGASWWDEAFEEAGYVNALQVRVLPEEADPMDLRYNVIHWTHRSTRGWSYGGSVVDPRTGEIIKGNVNLGSLRLRQDYLIALGLGLSGSAQCDVCAGPTGDYLAYVSQNDPVELALARVRQLSAHEVGHTLGFAHNYIASTYDRASVMDYPAPLARIQNGEIDLADAYDVGIGEFDKFAVRWAYSQFPEGVDEAQALEEIVRDGLERGMRFLTDRDARPAGGAHPLAALWDNGSDPIAMLRHEMRVRRIALDRFSDQILATGEPLAGLEEILVPIYFHHRYQVEAAAKSLAGVDYSFALRGDGQEPMEIVTPERQLEALDAVLETIDPRELAIDRRILDLIPPRAFNMIRGETFPSSTSPTFDPLAAAAAATRHSIQFLLQPQRMARLVDFHARDARYPSLEIMLDRILQSTWRAEAPSDAYLAMVQQTVRGVIVDMMIDQAESRNNTSAVRASLRSALSELASELQELEGNAHAALAAAKITRWLERPYSENDRSRTPTPPPGSPIGTP